MHRSNSTFVFSSYLFLFLLERLFHFDFDSNDCMIINVNLFFVNRFFLIFYIHIYTRNLKINFDKTYKIKDFNLSSRGEIIKGSLKIENPLSSEILEEKIDQFSIIDTDLKIDFDSKSKNFYNFKFSLDNPNWISHVVEWFKEFCC